MVKKKLKFYVFLDDINISIKTNLLRLKNVNIIIDNDQIEIASYPFTEIIKFAKKKKITSILFQGFGKLNKRISPDYYINFKHENYGITEDIFQSVMHCISQYIRSKFVSKNITL